MNIKSFLAPTTMIPPSGKIEKVDRSLKMESSHERDANGQEFYQKQNKKENKKEKMTDEQFDKAIALLREKSFVKDMHWVVIPIVDGALKYACVQDQGGVVIRKISELDLWEIFEDQTPETSKGQLLKRTA